MKFLSKSPANRNDKTLLFFVLLLISSLVLAGCGGNGGPGPTSTTHTSGPPTTDIMDFPSGSYQNTLLLTGGIFRISWTNTDDTISIGIKAKTTGWLAIAISPSLTKGQSDLIIGAVTGGVVSLVDSFDPGFSGGHPQDSLVGGSNDLFAISGSESGGITTIEFKRRLVTGDPRDIPLVNGNNAFLFALGPDDSMASEHSLVGSGEIAITLTHP
jgi:hypothetical protein